MRIGFDSFPIFHLTNGIGCHTYQLLRHLLQLDVDLEIVGCIPKGSVFGPEQLELAQCPRLTWVELEKGSRWHIPVNPGLDVFHGPNYKMYCQGRFGGIITIHDVFLDRHPEFTKKLLGQRFSFFRTKHTMKRARRIITVSSHAAREIHEIYGMPLDRIVVIPNGVSKAFGEPVSKNAWPDLKSRWGIQIQRYFLFLGGCSPRKNHRLLFHGFSQCPSLHDSHVLLCVGRREDRFGSLEQTAREFGIESRVVIREQVSFEELKVLYSAATACVVPSWYEGFGMPVLEAMASGTPVIAANATALPEVAGNAALLVDPQNSAEMADALSRIVENESLRHVLIERGRHRVREFSWPLVASRTYELYRELCV